MNWIKHTGTEMPVPRGTVIDIKCKNGDTFDGVQAGIKIEAISYFWRGTGSGCDIVEYRICEEGKKT